MRLKEVQKKLKEIESKGYIKAIRRGPTGIGYILENEFGLYESNIAIPDIGGRVELKGTRINSNSMITLFSFNRSVWKIKQLELIHRYGYKDDKARQALYSTVHYNNPNPQGFYIITDSTKNIVILKHEDEDNNIAEWSTYTLAGKFMTKMDRLLLAFADNKFINDIEYFHFIKAFLLQKPTPEKFLEAFTKNELMIDIRMHIKESGGVRNHGTALRMYEKNLMDLYSEKKLII
jgi:hypothetical protein